MFWSFCGLRKSIKNETLYTLMSQIEGFWHIELIFNLFIYFKTI